MHLALAGREYNVFVYPSLPYFQVAVPEIEAPSSIFISGSP
jgi:hypothetical protein